MSKEQSNLVEVEELVKLAQNGDVQAFGKLYDFYVQKIYRYFFFKVSQAEAFDLTENVFLKAWENLKKYQQQSGAGFSAWLFKIAHNQLVDFYRQFREHGELNQEIEDTRQESSPKSLTEVSLSQEMVRLAMGKLKKSFQEILTVCYLNDFDNEEAARILNKSEGALRVQKFRALQEMKKVLTEMGYRIS